MSHPHPTPERYPGVEFKDIGSNKLAQHLTLGQLADRLGCARGTLSKFILKERLFQPDFYSRKHIFFRENRIEELKEKWANRLVAFPISGPAKGVITSFGLMLPRVKPKEEVLRRMIQSVPKRRSRDSSWKTRKHYNLNDLKL